MRTLLMLGLLYAFSSPLFSQINFSCNYREVCEWNSKIQDFINCNKQEESSLFRMNEAETMFTHTTPTIESAYYINKKEKLEENDVWRLDVTSDVGNEYIYFLDIPNDEIRVLVDQGNDDFLLIRFYVKRMWNGN